MDIFCDFDEASKKFNFIVDFLKLILLTNFEMCVYIYCV